MSFLIRWFLPLCSKMTWTFLVPGPQMSGLHAKLQGKVILLRSWVSLQLHPVSALAPLGHTLAEPGPLDVGVLLVTDTPTIIHAMDNYRMVGCVCNEEDTNIKWTWLCEGVPKRCECGYWMELKTHPAPEKYHLPL